uniref:DRBM domain-containing protein n=1 Tax=Steinernema glaseri TaxID=37863 RepID=A0A1I8ANN0_9BILA
MTVRPASDSSFYAGKTILAPMVRAGRTPLCMLALKNGADLVYTEEIVDQRLLLSKRVENEALGTIDYVVESEVVLRIDPVKEKPRLFRQGDIGAIDVNMGCPKPFSISGGMGAALLSEPEKVKEILTALVEVAEVPVSCKIRVLDSREETLKFAKMVESCGVAAIGVHGRRRAERPGDANRNEEIREIAEALRIPVIANGGSSQIKCYEDIEKFRESSGASSVMIARKALSSPSIFRKEGLKTMKEEIEDFLDFVCEYDENFTTTKYVVQRILGGEQEFDPRGRQTVLSITVLEICKAWGREAKYEECKKAQLRHSHKRHWEPDPKTGICFFDISFPPKRLRMNAGAGSPKCVLNRYCDEMEYGRPKYHLIQRQSDGRYEAVAELCGKKYSSRIPQPNKKMAEQVAALVALVGLEQRDRLEGEWED